MSDFKTRLLGQAVDQDLVHGHNIMDMDSLEYEDLDADEALELMERAQERIDVYTKNKKVLPPKKAAVPNQTAPATPAAKQKPIGQGQAPPATGGNGNGSRRAVQGSHAGVYQAIVSFQ